MIAEDGSELEYQVILFSLFLYNLRFFHEKKVVFMCLVPHTC